MWCSFAVAGMTQVDFCFGTGRKSAAFLPVTKTVKSANFFGKYHYIILTTQTHI